MVYKVVDEYLLQGMPNVFEKRLWLGRQSLVIVGNWKEKTNGKREREYNKKKITDYWFKQGDNRKIRTDYHFAETDYGSRKESKGSGEY